MKSLVLVTLFIILHVTILSAGGIDTGATLVGPNEPGILVKGPTNRATVKGPSGPIIVTAGDTGAVSSGRKNGGVVNVSGQSPGIISSTIPLSPVAPVESILPLAAPIYEEIPSYAPALHYSNAEDALY